MSAPQIEAPVETNPTIPYDASSSRFGKPDYRRHPDWHNAYKLGTHERPLTCSRTHTDSNLWRRSPVWGCVYEPRAQSHTGVLPAY